MLVLTRKLQEQLRIGDNVTVTVLRVKGNTVRLGIEAPRDVPVLRGELPRFDDEAPESNVEASEAGEVESAADGLPVAADAAPATHPAELTASDDDAEDPHVVRELSEQGRSLAARVEQCLRQADAAASLDAALTQSCTQG